ANYFAGQYDRAIADYTDALRLTPNDSKRYVARGWAYYGTFNIAAALADADKAIALGPKDPGPHELRASIHQRLGKTGEATGDLRAALRADPSREEDRKALQRLGAQP